MTVSVDINVSEFDESKFREEMEESKKYKELKKNSINTLFAIAKYTEIDKWGTNIIHYKKGSVKVYKDANCLLELNKKWWSFDNFTFIHKVKFFSSYDQVEKYIDNHPELIMEYRPKAFEVFCIGIHKKISYPPIFKLKVNYSRLSDNSIFVSEILSAHHYADGHHNIVSFLVSPTSFF